MTARRGVFVFVVLLAFLGAALLFALFAVGETGGRTPSSTALIWEVPSDLEESPPQAERFSVTWFRPARPTVWDVVTTLRHAAKDDHIESLVLHLDGIDWGWAKVAEVRAAIEDFRRAGKPVFASLSDVGDREYLLASAADVVAAPPLTVLQIDGLTASGLFLRGTFDKLDITPNFASVGKYKSGVEQFTRSDMSAPAREALEALLDDAFRVLVDTVAAARASNPESITALLDRGPFTVNEAIVAGLLDTVLYRPDLDSLACQGEGDVTRVPYPMWRYRAGRPRGGRAPRIAIVAASGTILEGRSRSGVLGSETLIKTLREVRERDAVKAVVLRIDSPGGSAVAADEIWREVVRCRRAKPVIASFSDLAASGGYYIAAGTDSIVGHPATITGSIGVYGGKLNILGLYRKLGLNVETVARGRNAQMLSPYRDFSPEESDRFGKSMELVYRTFVSRVAEGRGMDTADVDLVGQGRVWSGVDARERGLMDALGGFEAALAMARHRAGIAADEEIVVDFYPKVEVTILQRLMAELIGEGDEQDLWSRAGLPWPPVVRAWIAAATFPAGQALALMPWSIEIR